MSQILIALSFWFHSLATILLIGHYLLLTLIYLPVLSEAGGTYLSEISKRSRSWLYISLLIFVITGVHLTFIDPNYLGIGNFDNFWSIMMLVKHILLLVMLAMGFWFNGILRIGPLMRSNTGASQALVRFRQYSSSMTITGILILLLTAISQTQ